MQEKVKPNVRTYTALITALGNAKQWKRAMATLHAMKNDQVRDIRGAQRIHILGAAEVSGRARAVGHCRAGECHTHAHFQKLHLFQPRTSQSQSST